MGLSFGKSFKMGPLRLNLSGSGLGVSAGIRGARVSVGPRGTYVTLSGLGFRYQKKLKATPASLPANAAASTTSQPLAALATTEGHIATASVAQLQDSSPEELLSEIQQRAHRFNWFLFYVVLATLALVSLAATELAMLLLPAALVLSGGAVAVYLWNRDRRTTRLIYDVDNPALLERFAVCNAVGEALSQTDRLWHVYYNVRTHDQKRSAGASTLIQRTRIRCVARPLPAIDCNIEPWSIPAGPQQILFLPDRLIVYESGRFAGVPYQELDVAIEETAFVEVDSVPSDARVVGQTWRFVNKSGGPDRRFNNNRQLPVVAYFKVSLQSRSGMHIVFQLSSGDAARGAKVALDRLCQTSLPAPSLLPEASAARPSARGPEPSAEAPPPVPNAESSARTTALAVVTVLRSIAVADRRFSTEEKHQLEAAVRELAAGDSSLQKALLSVLSELRSDPSSVADALAWLSARDAQVQRRVLELANAMALADGSVTPKEKERIEAIRAALPLSSAEGTGASS